jgi:hypothetical protein
MHGSYEFALLDPRRGPQAETVNDRVFAAGPVYGVEVTVPALAARCVENIDPQHTGGDITTAAIEVALTSELPPAGATIATVRPDLDAFGSMAVLAMRADGVEFEDGIRGRIQEIAAADKAESEWRPGLDVDAVSGRQALLVVVFDARRDVAERVAAVRTWLETGTFPGLEAAVVQVRRERSEQVVLDREVRLVAGGRVAVIESTSRFAIGVAYRHAAVVIAVNPAFGFQGGPEHRKVTICQAEPGHVELGEVRDELAAIEAGWGGSPTIIGSPQGESTTIELDRLVAVVERHLAA